MKEFIHDGSFEGLLTAVFHAFPHREDCTITRAGDHVPNLVDQPVPVETSEELSTRVYRGIEEKLGRKTLKKVYYLYLSGVKGTDTLVLNYLRLCFRHGPRINLAKNHDLILQVDKHARRVSLEAHRFQGFLRFTEIAPLHFYAAIEPDHDILPLIAGSFARRFSDQCFVIHDLTRESAVLFNRREIVITDLTREQGRLIESRLTDDPFQDLWRDFYQAVSISERQNEALRRRLMPRRYWKHLTEMQE